MEALRAEPPPFSLPSKNILGRRLRATVKKRAPAFDAGGSPLSQTEGATTLGDG